MIAILEKYEHNADFHPIVDFVEASYIRRNLKLKDEARISSLPDAELFENLTLMGQYTKRARIAQSSALLTIADEPASPLGDDSQDLYTRLQRQQTKMASKLTAKDLEIASLKARIKMLDDKDRGGDDPYGEDATIKGMSLEIGEEAGIERSTNKGSNNTEEMVNVLTSLDAACILTSGVQVSVPLAEEVGTVSIPPAGEIHTISVPNASPIFTTAIVATPYSRRKGKEKMRKDRVVNDLVKYQDNYAKVLKYQSQQRKPLSKKQQKEFYMSVLRSHAGWKTKHFKGMSQEEIREKFVPVWKQIEDFVPMGSKEEGERFKRKGIRLE
uniref:Uncharacterized protein n=1 Tax=Tanacetum cinerariifolium TaxID=118510 RepID=A0A699J925_TANCI|nr:hypothetical protein [Tanacetum cinerariifolium]